MVTAPTLLTPVGTRRLRWSAGVLIVAGDEASEVPRDAPPGHAIDRLAGPLDQVLGASGQPPLAERTAVVAVGSNGSAEVLAAKLAEAGESLWVPMVPGQIRGVAVGHSAHISLRGYVAAAPYASPGAVTSAVLSWFTPAQLAALDATEPHYRRVRLAHADYPFTAGNLEPVGHYDLYESVHGVIALAGVVVPLGTQAELHAMIAAEPHLAAVAPWAQPELIEAALSTAEVRAAFVRVVAEQGYARSSGLRRAQQES